MPPSLGLAQGGRPKERNKFLLTDYPPTANYPATSRNPSQQTCKSATHREAAWRTLNSPRSETPESGIRSHARSRQQPPPPASSFASPSTNHPQPPLRKLDALPEPEYRPRRPPRLRTATVGTQAGEPGSKQSVGRRRGSASRQPGVQGQAAPSSPDLRIRIHRPHHAALAPHA
jgi:hypothetical protein